MKTMKKSFYLNGNKSRRLIKILKIFTPMSDADNVNKIYIGGRSGSGISIKYGQPNLDWHQNDDDPQNCWFHVLMPNSWTKSRQKF
jgi:hypothetical protein